jgi:colicin import membrane protein
MTKSTTKAPAASSADRPEATGVRIRPDWDSLTKVQAASGKRSFDNADALAVALRGKTLAEAYSICAKALKAEGEPTTVKALTTRYGHLNPGHQRMCIGNKVRAAMKRSADGVIRT